MFTSGVEALLQLLSGRPGGLTFVRSPNGSIETVEDDHPLTLLEGALLTAAQEPLRAAWWGAVRFDEPTKIGPSWLYACRPDPARRAGWVPIQHWWISPSKPTKCRQCLNGGQGVEKVPLVWGGAKRGRPQGGKPAMLACQPGQEMT